MNWIFLSKIKEKKGRAAMVFRLKEKICGKKKSTSEPSAISHPQKKIQIKNPSQIKVICADYCEN